MNRKRNLLVYLVAGWSGFFVMLVELLGGRLIAPYFGSSIYVWGSVIFIFMLGLSAGYLAGGIWSKYNPSMFRLCLILVAAAITTTPTVLFSDWLLNAIFEADWDPRYGSLMACAGLYLVPTILSGMISPYAIRIIVRNRASSGHDAGYLYFVSTLGSSAGTLLTSFYLVLWLEVNTILIGAMAVSITIGLLGLLARFQEPDQALEAEDAEIAVGHSAELGITESDRMS